jgi:hypothetical protein
MGVVWADADSALPASSRQAAIECALETGIDISVPILIDAGPAFKDDLILFLII